MTTITLKLAFDYRPKLLPGLERDPRVCFYLSSDVGHHVAIVDPYEERPSVSFDIAVPQHGKPFIPRDAALHVWQFATVDNDSGEASTNEAGYAMFPLNLLLSNMKPVQMGQELVVMNARNAKRGIDASKGAITLYVDKASFPNGRSPFLPPSKYDITAENQKFIVQTLSNYIQSNNSIFQQKASTYESVKYLHLPLWSWGAYSVAGSAFAIPRAQPSPEAWWLNASRMALRRHYQHLSLDEAIAQFLAPETSEEEVMTVVSKMHTGVVNHVATYLSDGIYVGTGRSISEELEDTVFSGVEGAFAEDICRSVGAKPIVQRRVEADLLIAGGSHANRNAQFVNMEAFTLGRMRIAAHTAKGADNSGDCEDDAGEICLQSMELKTLQTSDPVLAKMRDIRQHYMIVQVLAGVRGAQLSDAAKKSMKDSAHAKLGGHMFAVYMSKERFLAMHSKYNQAKPLYEGLEPGPPGVRSPALALEGTGLVDPLGSPEYAASIDGMRYLLKGSGSAFKRIKFTQPQSRTQLNSFYRVIQSFAVPDLADEYSSIEHVVMKKQRNGSVTTGADWLEFLNGDATLSTYSMPNMKEDEIQVTKRILNQRFPIVGYQEPAAPVESSPAHNDNLQSVSDFVGRLGRAAGDYWVVDFYPRYTQVNAELARNWIQLIEAKSRIVDFQYYEENLGPNVGGYLARFYVSK